MHVWHSSLFGSVQPATNDALLNHTYGKTKHCPPRAFHKSNKGCLMFFQLIQLFHPQDRVSSEGRKDRLRRRSTVHHWIYILLKIFFPSIVSAANRLLVSTHICESPWGHFSVPSIPVQVVREILWLNCDWAYSKLEVTSHSNRDSP